MEYSFMDLVGDSLNATKKANKKKLHQLLDKHGSVEAIEETDNLRDSYQFGLQELMAL